MDQLLSSQPMEDSSPEQHPSRVSATNALAHHGDAGLAVRSTTGSKNGEPVPRVETPRRAHIILSPDELYELTHYRAAAKQLEELRRQGFYRARVGRTGVVVLERAHFEAVCRGLDNTASQRPKVRPYRSKQQNEKGHSTAA